MKEGEKMSTITAPNIQEELRKAGCVIEHYCTDLHTPVTEASTKIVNNFEFKQNVTKFTSQIDGVLYYDIPFCYKETIKKPELDYISIKDMSCSTEDYPRNVTIAFGGNKNKITLLGNLSHGTELSIDKENGEKLIKLIKSCIK